MTKRFFPILFLVTLSCATSKKHINKPYKLIKAEDSLGFNFLTFTSKVDTIMAVIPNNEYRFCKKRKFRKFNDTTYKKVNNVGNDSISIKFYFTVETNKGFRINAGEFAPGDVKNMIYSYKDFPYFIDDCQPFKSK